MSTQLNWDSLSAASSVAAHSGEHPILFSASMVRAILEGRKTNTRRVIKTLPGGEFCDLNGYGNAVFTADQRTYRKVKNPYGGEGDCLWVRESFYAFGKYVYTGKRTDTGKLEVEFLDTTYLSGYRYQYAEDVTLPKPPSRYELGWHKRPSIFMPRAASRITLEILKVRVERLREITSEDIVAEGVGESWWPESNLRAQWKEGWGIINGKRPGCAWRDNPWVWVIEFPKQ